MDSTIREIVGRETDLFHAHGGHIPEACQELNDLQREKITAIYKYHETAYIGQINFHGDEHKNLTVDNVFTKYSGETVCNSGAAFVIPTEDMELAELIVEWNKNPMILDVLKKIFNRIEVIGGLNLIWV